MDIHIGTSGWQYRDWNGTFYPDNVKKDQLTFYATKFDTVEINSTFYHIPRESTCEKWYTETPDNFVFTLKLYRGITHYNKLIMNNETRRMLREFCVSAVHLGDKLGMILVQLPPSLKKDIALLGVFADAVCALEKELHCQLPLTLEVRNASWFDEEVEQFLNDKKIGWVINDSPNRWPSANFVTNRQPYIRFHGNKILYRSSYDDEELREWAQFIAEQNATDV